MIGLGLLRGLAGSVHSGDPFVAKNLRRLRGLVFILAEVFAHGVGLREDIEGTI